MVKSTTSKQKPVSREILVRELSALEKRFDSKMDSNAQSFKEYVDSRIAPLRGDMQKQGDKMDRYFNGIVKMIEGVIGKVAGNGEQLESHEGRLENHERRLTALEAKA